MTTYLTIITTVLVLTQIIRLTQNAIQLKRIEKMDSHKEELMDIWRRIDNSMDYLVNNRRFSPHNRTLHDNVHFYKRKTVLSCTLYKRNIARKSKQLGGHNETNL